MNSKKILDGKITFVSGATRGLGRALALCAAEAGSHILAVGRTQSALESLDDEITRVGGSASLVPLDLRNGDDIDQLGGYIAERWGRLDILIAAAARLGDITPLPHLSPKEWQETFEVNATANYRLIRSFDSLLRSAKDARGIFVSCGATETLPACWGGYSASKAAMEALVLSYAKEVAAVGIKINILDPGVMRTRMRKQAFPGEQPDGLASPQDIAAAILPLLSLDWQTSGEILRYPDDFA